MRKLATLIASRSDLALIGLLAIIILVMIVPLPTAMIDFLIVLNIALTLLVLAVSVYLKRADDFTVFPAIILIATTFRLAISISTTRLILSEADAGQVIATFGSFVTADSVIVGLVIFLIITTVQFIVITKGAERVAEVAARFNLDGMPGRQMSIDSELRAGDITPEQANERRKQLEKENSFYGAMDGAMKFVKGDAIAGLIIIAINLIGGISVGTLSDGLSAGAAVDIYSRLTVGDGLVGQIPALIIAMCAGTIITRVNAGGSTDLGSDLAAQLGSNARAMSIAGLMIAALALVPGFPSLAFLFVGFTLFGISWVLGKREKENAVKRNPDGTPVAVTTDADTAKAQPGDVVSVHVAPTMMQSLDKAGYVTVRDKDCAVIGARTGLAVPHCGLVADDACPAEQVRIMLDGVAAFSASVPENSVVAVCDQDMLTLCEVEGAPLGREWQMVAAWWVDQSKVHVLENAGVDVMTVGELLGRTASRFIDINYSRMIGYHEVQQIVRELGAEHQNLASQVSQAITAVQMLNIFRSLLEEGVPLMPRRILFEALLEATVNGGTTDHFVNCARLAMGRQICSTLSDDNNMIAGYVIEPSVEIALRGTLQEDNNGTLRVVPDLELAKRLLTHGRHAIELTQATVTAPVVLTAPDLRLPIYNFYRHNGTRIKVLAYNEVTAEFRFHVVGAFGAEAQNAGYSDAA